MTGPGTPGLRIRPAEPRDQAWIERFLGDHASLRIARRDELLQAFDHPMLIAERHGAPVGLATYVLRGTSCEILTLHATVRWTGVGSALVDAVIALAASLGCRTTWLITTNDNVDALRFYQRRGFRIRVIRPGAVDEARRSIKPEIPEIGEHGIPIRDEIELERRLSSE